MKNKNSDNFFQGTIFYSRLIGFEFDNQDNKISLHVIIGLVTNLVVILGQIFNILFIKNAIEIRAIYAAYLSYFLVAGAKLLSLLYYRKKFNGILNEFRQIYPTRENEKKFNLSKYLNQCLLIEKVLSGFFKVATFVYIWSAFLLSFVDLARIGEFTFKTPVILWFFVDTSNNVYFYAVNYLMQTHASSFSATVILALDLCLYSMILQLCMHFDLIHQKILMIDTLNGATEQLKEQIVYHQKMLGLADRLNEIFTPSLMFSLLSSTLILGFTGFQLLDDLTLLKVVKAMCLLAFEMKQVAITCFLGDKLVDNGLKVNEAIYEHKWYDGPPEYKKYVMIALIRSQQSVALNIAGVSDISLQTFRRVMSISYQMFTILQ